MQTNIELVGASGRVIGLPVPVRRERQRGAEKIRMRPSLVTIASEMKRWERMETVVWGGIALAAIVLLLMSFAS